MATSTGRARSRSRVRPELSREVILDAALRVIDSDGEHQLTFRRLGAELGADPTACFRYFASKDDLLLALADRLLGEAIDRVPLGLPWRESLREHALSVYGELLRHPRLAVLVGVRTTRGSQEARAIEQLLASLAEAGLSGAEAVDVWHGIADTTLAWASFEATYAGLPDDVRTNEDVWTDNLAGLPAETYPHIAAARPHLTSSYEGFPIALDLMLDGIAARLDQRRNA